MTILVLIAGDRAVLQRVNDGADGSVTVKMAHPKYPLTALSRMPNDAIDAKTMPTALPVTCKEIPDGMSFRAGFAVGEVIINKALVAITLFSARAETNQI